MIRVRVLQTCPAWIDGYFLGSHTEIGSCGKVISMLNYGFRIIILRFIFSLT